jgi:cytoskeletal protein RodZ
MPPERTPSGFGARLREARERRGISLRQIANATKISVGVLEALEHNDISKLPGGIFGRAFVRSYAIEVGLDPEATIQEFIAQFPNDSVTAGHPASARSEDHVAVEGERQTARTFLWLITISAPVAAGLLYFATIGRQTPPAPAPSPPPVAAETPALTEPPPPAAAEQPVPSPVVGAPVPTTTPTTPEPVAGAAVPAATSGPPPADVRPATAPDDQLTVGLTARRPCWVSATVDGQKFIDRLLQAGEQRSVTVRREMVLTAGDASAIALQFNGADARALGKAGEVVTARFNPANYKDYLQVR